MASSSRPSTAGLMDAVKYRRTVYTLNDQAPIPDSRILELVHEAMLYVPSSFNQQAARLLVILGDKHKKFWDLVIENVKPAILANKGEEGWQRNLDRLKGFQAGYGTIVFAEDNETVRKMQKNIPEYENVFPQWSEHSSAMHQFTLWTALELEGFGANLQHYNAFPGMEAAVQKEYGWPADYSIKAQLVFGGYAGEHPARKDKLPTDQTVKVV